MNQDKEGVEFNKLLPLDFGLENLKFYNFRL